MKMRFAVLLAAACVALSPSFAPAQPGGKKGSGASAGKYGWVSSLQEGKDLAAKTGKPLMVVMRCEP